MFSMAPLVSNILLMASGLHQGGTLISLRVLRLGFSGQGSLTRWGPNHRAWADPGGEESENLTLTCLIPVRKDGDAEDMVNEDNEGVGTGRQGRENTIESLPGVRLR